MFLGSLKQHGREGHMLHLVRKVGKNGETCSHWEKGNFILIYEFKYGETRKNYYIHLVFLFTVPLKGDLRNIHVMKNCERIV